VGERDPRRGTGGRADAGLGGCVRTRVADSEPGADLCAAGRARQSNGSAGGGVLATWPALGQLAQGRSVLGSVTRKSAVPAVGRSEELEEDRLRLRHQSSGACPGRSPKRGTISGIQNGAVS